MKIMMLTRLPGFGSTVDRTAKAALVEKIVESLRFITKAFKGRLGKSELLVNDTLYLEIPNDEVYSRLKEIVEKAGMVVAPMTPEEIFLERCRAIEQPTAATSAS